MAATDARSFRTFLLMQQFAAAEIGARIAQARREANGMTQEQLAELLDVSTRAVQDYEAGARIPWKHFKRLEQLFKKELEWFLHGESTTPTNLAEKLDDIRRLIEGLQKELQPGQQLDERLKRIEEQLRSIAVAGITR